MPKGILYDPGKSLLTGQQRGVVTPTRFTASRYIAPGELPTSKAFLPPFLGGSNASNAPSNSIIASNSGTVNGFQPTTAVKSAYTLRAMQSFGYGAAEVSLVNDLRGLAAPVQGVKVNPAQASLLESEPVYFAPDAVAARDAYAANLDRPIVPSYGSVAVSPLISGDVDVGFNRAVADYNVDIARSVAQRDYVEVFPEAAFSLGVSDVKPAVLDLAIRAPVEDVIRPIPQRETAAAVSDRVVAVGRPYVELVSEYHRGDVFNLFNSSGSRGDVFAGLHHRDVRVVEGSVVAKDGLGVVDVERHRASVRGGRGRLVSSEKYYEHKLDVFNGRVHSRGSVVGSLLGRFNPNFIQRKAAIVDKQENKVASVTAFDFSNSVTSTPNIVSFGDPMRDTPSIPGMETYFVPDPVSLTPYIPGPLRNPYLSPDPDEQPNPTGLLKSVSETKIREPSLFGPEGAHRPAFQYNSESRGRRGGRVTRIYNVAEVTDILGGLGSGSIFGKHGLFGEVKRERKASKHYARSNNREKPKSRRSRR